MVGIPVFPKATTPNSAVAYPSAIRSRLGNAETEGASAATRLIGMSTTTPCRSAQRYSLRTIPNWIASGKVRYHSSRQLASTRWVPANTQK
jgi:hypothetical protein